eukprot:TRINITY_DN36769_c0_g1_i1.p1 TRINITY_DN36769_c0_g1~~TRINITY_DN36769_c0_g1_i1.p1  ORF type:complete len:559 (-),score=104.06 TRINITY_DN36769_c0_g1_i1:201-1877(-)
MGRGRGKDGKETDKGNDVLNTAFAEKTYKSDIQNLIRNTPVQAGDFDSKAILLLDALQEKGRAMEACQHLQNSLQGISSRKKISNPRAYIYTLLRGFDESAYLAMKAEGGSENRRRRRHQHIEKDGNDEEGRSGGAPVNLSLNNVLEEGKKLREEAAEFVPGKLWSQPGAEVPKRPLRYDAVEFVPHQQVLSSVGRLATPSSAAASAMRPTAPEFKPSSKQFASEFRTGHSAWSGAAIADTREFLQAYGQVWPSPPLANVPATKKTRMAERKAKATKAGTVTPAAGRSAKSPSLTPQPEEPRLAARAFAPGAIGFDTTEADTSAARPASQKGSSYEALSAVGAVSDVCRKVLSAHYGPRQLLASDPWPVLQAGKQVAALREVFSISDCKYLLYAAGQFGFRPAAQDSVDGSPCKLTSDDAWLSAELWQRLKDHVPLVFKGRPVLGLEDRIDFIYGSLRQTLAKESPGNLALQACLSSGEGEPRQGDLLIFQTEGVGSDSGKIASWLHVKVKCGKSSLFSMVQSALGFGGSPSECRRRGMAVLLLLSASAAFPLLRRRR